jgi:ribosomal protein L37E
MSSPSYVVCDRCGNRFFIIGSGNCPNCKRAFASQRTSTKTKNELLKIEEGYDKTRRIERGNKFLSNKVR